MKDALDKVRSALSKQDIVPQLAHYLVRDGMIHASDGRLTAAAPFPYKGSFLVAGADFEKLLDHLPQGAITITESEKAVTIKAGRLRGTIQTLPLDTVAYPTPGMLWNEPPHEFLAALRLVRPFISENAVHRWALCAYLGDGVIRATTNVSLVEVYCPGLRGHGQLLPCWAVDYLLKREEYLTHVQFLEANVAFRWEDGSWMRTQLVNEKFPDVAERLLKDFREPEHEITAEWRTAYQLVAELTEDRFEVLPDKMMGYRGASVFEHEVASLGTSKWNPKFLGPVIAAASHWQPDMWPQPVTFRGHGLRGIIVGRS